MCTSAQPTSCIPRLGAILLPIILLSVHPLQAGAQSGTMETWLDETGQHKIEAKFIGINGADVVLETADGKQRRVPYAKLSLSSQFKAKKLADPKAFDAPPLPSAYAPPPLPDNPIPEDATIDQFLDAFFGQMKEGHPEVIWYAAPPEMRSELEAVIAKGAEVLGPTTFRQMQAVLPNVLTIVRDKRSFIVAHPAIAAQPDVAKGLNQALPAFEPVIEIMTQKSTWNAENFKAGNVGPWIMLFAKDFVNATEKANTALRAAFGPAAASSLNDVSYKVLEKTADSAKVQFVNNKVKNVVVFKRINGYWLPEQVEQFKQQLSEARAYLDQMDQAAIDSLRTQIRTGLTFSNTFLTGMANAKSQQEFNQVVEPIASMVRQALPAAGRSGMAGGKAASMLSGGGMGGMGGMNSGGMNSGGEMPNSGGYSQSGPSKGLSPQ